MPLHATVVDDLLVVLGVPHSHPHTLDRRVAVELVGIDSLTLHLLTNRHSPLNLTLVQHRVGSGLAVINLIVHVAQYILVSGNALPIHVKLGSKLGYSSLPQFT